MPSVEPQDIVVLKMDNILCENSSKSRRSLKFELLYVIDEVKNNSYFILFI